MKTYIQGKLSLEKLDWRICMWILGLKGLNKVNFPTSKGFFSLFSSCLPDTGEKGMLLSGDTYM